MDIRPREGPFKKAQFERTCGEGEIETTDRKDSEEQGSVRSSAASISIEGATYRSADRVKGISKRHCCTQSLATVWSHYILLHPYVWKVRRWTRQYRQGLVNLGAAVTVTHRNATKSKKGVGGRNIPTFLCYPWVGAPTNWNRSISVLYCDHLCMKCSLGSLIFLKKSLIFPILLFSSISLHWSLRNTYLSLLFFGTLHSNRYIFPFLLGLSLLFLFQLFVRPPQTAILPFCSSFSWGWFWLPPHVQCHEHPAIVLWALYQS